MQLSCIIDSDTPAENDWRTGVEGSTPAEERTPTRTVRIDAKRVQILWGDVKLDLARQEFWDFMELMSDAALRLAEAQARAQRGRTTATAEA